MRPAERITSSIASGGNSWPCCAPAEREIDSFISVPPRSLTPARSAAATPSGPSLTHETCTFVIHGCSARRATACTSSVSPKVGPLRAWPRSHIGASMCTNGSGTNSVKPPDRSCCSRARNRCRAQLRGPSSVRERAEPATEVAEVRVLDVARNHVGDLVAADVVAKAIGRGEHALPLLPARPEQPDDLVLPQLV